MKTLFLAGLLSLAAPVTHANNPGVATSVYTTPQSSRVVVHIVKPLGREYRLRLVDRAGTVLHLGRMAKSQRDNWHVMNLDPLPDGIYWVELKDARNRILKRQPVELVTHDGWSAPKGRQATVLNF